MAFCVGKEQYGVVREDSWRELSKFPDVFLIDERDRTVKLNEQLQTPDKRTEKVNEVLVKLREDQVFHCLKGWRNEVSYACVRACAQPSPQPLHVLNQGLGPQAGVYVVCIHVCMSLTTKYSFHGSVTTMTSMLRIPMQHLEDQQLRHNTF